LETSARSSRRRTWPLGRAQAGGGRDAFFNWQERALDLLLVWGLGNVTVGGVVAAARPGLARYVGIQAVAWGTVNSAAAFYALCVTRRYAVSARAGLMGARQIQTRAERFEYLLAVQAGLDLVAALVSGYLVTKARSDWARGTTIGVLIQSSALLAYDLAVSGWTIARPETHRRDRLA
jgi:hypothetical protein